MVGILKITGRQFAAFEAQELKRFRDEVTRMLRTNLPNEFGRKSDAEIGSMIDWGIAKAKRYDIVLEPDVARFIELVGPLGQNFDTNPKTAWVDNTLRRTHLTTSDRFRLVLERLAFGAV